MSVTFRAVTENDRTQVESWIASDPAHRNVSADLLLDGNGSASVYAIEDDKGTVMYVRQETEGSCVRLHAQFCTSSKRSFNSLKEAYPVVKADAKARGFTGIIFDSVSPALVRCMMDLGFKAECRAEL